MAGVGKGEIRARFELTPRASVVARGFREAGVEFGDWRPAWPRAGAAMRAGILRAMHSRGKTLEVYSGFRWPKSSGQYLARKLRSGFGSEPLVRRGRLKGRVMTAVPTGGKRSVSITLPGKHLPYLQFKLGYWFVGWDDKARTEVRAAVDAYVQQVFARVRAKLRGA